LLWIEKRGRTKEDFAQCFCFSEEWEARKNSAERIRGKAGEVNGRPGRSSVDREGRVK